MPTISPRSSSPRSSSPRSSSALSSSPTPGTSTPGSSTITLRKVRKVDDAGADAINVSLFLDEADRVCGWFIGPLRFTDGGIDIAYLPRSEGTIASVAVVRAMETARACDLPLNVVDPDDLWGFAWRG